MKKKRGKPKRKAVLLVVAAIMAAALCFGGAALAEQGNTTTDNTTVEGDQMLDTSGVISLTPETTASDATTSSDGKMASARESSGTCYSAVGNSTFGSAVQIFLKTTTGSVNSASGCKQVYCFEAGKKYYTNSVMTQSNLLDSGTKQILGDLMCYGFKANTAYPGAAGANNGYSGTIEESMKSGLTQYMVWGVMAGNTSSSSLKNYMGSAINTAGQKWSGSKDWTYSVIDSALNLRKTPSFNGNTITLNWNEANNRFEKTITDNNGALGNFNYKLNGVTFQKNGNKLTIYTTSEFSTATRATATYTSPQGAGSGCITTWKNGSGSGFQNVIEYNNNTSNKVTITTDIKIKTNTIPYKVTVNKKDKSNSSKLAGAIFKLYDGSKEIATLKDNGNGAYTYSGKATAGKKFTVKETAAPKWYNIDKAEVGSFTVKASSNAFTFNATDTEKPISYTVKLEKQDSVTKKTIAGAVFTIYDGSQKVADLKDNGDGTYSYSGEVTATNPRKALTIKETKAPIGYVINNKTLTFTPKRDNSSSATPANNFEFTTANGKPFTDDFITGKIDLTKTDSETGGKAQGDATLKGATYLVFANANIKHPDGKTAKSGGYFYTKYNNGDNESSSSYVGKITTDANGKGSLDTNKNSEKPLFIGEYVVVEKTASTGYLVNNEPVKVTLKASDNNSAKVSSSAISKETVKKQAFGIKKISKNTTNGVTTNVQGAEFTIKLKSEVDKSGWDSAKQYGKTLATDKDGRALSDELPYGVYIVRETKVPEGLIKVDDFTVTIKEDSRTPQPYSSFTKNDAPYQAYLQIIKKDSETGKTVAVAGAEFKLKDSATGKAVTFKNGATTIKTDSNGVAKTPDALCAGTYEISEIKAPTGYMLNNQIVKFAFNAKTGTGGQLTAGAGNNAGTMAVEFKDTPVKGQINLVKTGEMLTGANQNQSGMTFTYEIKGLEGVEFKVYAAENIYSGDKTVWKKSGETVGTMVTDKDGKASLDKLYMGTYKVVETKVPEGYVLDKTEHKVQITADGQSKNVIIKDLAVKNKRQKLNASAVKIDKTSKKALSGATLGLYAAEDIKDYKGSTIVKADTLISSATSGADGNVAFAQNLPISKYYLKEIKAPTGYKSLGDAKISVDAQAGAATDETVIIKKTVENEKVPTKVCISKTDITNGKELPGAKLKVVNKKTGEVVDQWTSTDTPHYIEGKLEVGTEYELTEITAPNGYEKAETITFTVKENGEVTKVVMKDAPEEKNVGIVKSAVVGGKIVNDSINMGSSLKVGDVVTYKLKVTNNSKSSTVSNVIVRDPIPVNTAYVAKSASDSGALKSINGRDTVVWVIDKLAAGESKELSFQVKICSIEKDIVNMGNFTIADSSKNIEDQIKNGTSVNSNKITITAQAQPTKPAPTTNSNTNTNTNVNNNNNNNSNTNVNTNTNTNNNANINNNNNTNTNTNNNSNTNANTNVNENNNGNTNTNTSTNTNDNGNKNTNSSTNTNTSTNVNTNTGQNTNTSTNKNQNSNSDTNISENQNIDQNETATAETVTGGSNSNDTITADNGGDTVSEDSNNVTEYSESGNDESAQTNDNSNMLPIILIGLAALLLIVVLTMTGKKRKRGRGRR